MSAYFFAWVDPAETTFGPEHHVYDENVYSFVRELKEGDCPKLTIDIRNPRIGLLATGRKVWAWLARDGGTDVEPLFFGRLVGIPTDILGNVVTLQFVAQPADFLEQKEALAETLKVPPYYDPIFIDEKQRDNPDTVLEGYSAIWHVDPSDLTVTISDIIVGEDGVVDFSDGVPRDSVQIKLGQAPVTSVTVNATVTWTQQITGTVDLGRRTFTGYTLDGLLGDWPKPGASLGKGWSVFSSEAIDVNDVANSEVKQHEFHYKNAEKEHLNGDTLSVDQSWTTLPNLKYESVVTNLKAQVGFFDPFADPQINVSPSTSYTRTYIPLWTINTSLVIQYDPKRDRTERVVFTLYSDLQPIITDTGQQNEIIDLNGSDVGLITGDTGGIAPIVDPSRHSYFPTALDSIEYLLCVARARLLVQSRAVEISWECPIDQAIGLTCRMNARIFDDRIPGGVALGKIIATSISCNGDDGTEIGSVTIACAIGYGGAVSEVEGTPVYVEVGYVEPGYQYYTGNVSVLPAGDIGYTVPEDYPAGELVFPLTREQVVVREEVHGSVDDQQEFIRVEYARLDQLWASFLYVQLIPPSFEEGTNAYEAFQERVAEQLQQVSIQLKEQYPIWYDLELKSLDDGPFDYSYGLVITDLKVPKQIDLEAPAI